MVLGEQIGEIIALNGASLPIKDDLIISYDVKVSQFVPKELILFTDIIRLCLSIVFGEPSENWVLAWRLIDDENKHVWVTGSSQVLEVRMLFDVILPKVDLSEVSFITNAVLKVAELDAMVTPEEKVVSVDQVVNSSMFFCDVDTLKVYVSVRSFFRRKFGTLIVVDCWRSLLLSFHVLLNLVPVEPFTFRVILKRWFLIYSNTDVHFVVDNKAKVDFTNVFKSALVEPVKLVELISIICLEKKFFDVLENVYLFDKLEIKNCHFEDTDGHVPLNFLLVW